MKGSKSGNLQNSLAGKHAETSGKTNATETRNEIKENKLLKWERSALLRRDLLLVQMKRVTAKISITYLARGGQKKWHFLRWARFTWSATTTCCVNHVRASFWDRQSYNLCIIDNTKLWIHFCLILCSKVSKMCCFAHSRDRYIRCSWWSCLCKKCHFFCPPRGTEVKVSGDKTFLEEIDQSVVSGMPNPTR